MNVELLVASALVVQWLIGHNCFINFLLLSNVKPTKSAVHSSPQSYFNNTGGGTSKKIRKL
jgi:hypothetical protein